MSTNNTSITKTTDVVEEKPDMPTTTPLSTESNPPVPTLMLMDPHLPKEPLLVNITKKKLFSITKELDTVKRMTLIPSKKTLSTNP